MRVGVEVVVAVVKQVDVDFLPLFRVRAGRCADDAEPLVIEMVSLLLVPVPRVLRGGRCCGHRC